jgi:hypothetical protein
MIDDQKIMSVCSALDPIEDFLLSSAANAMAPMQSSTGVNNAVINLNNISSNRIMGPPMATTNLNGLNLSLNHGLDLTCPTYGCLNLTQPQRQESTGLNLTQHPTTSRGGKKSSSLAASASNNEVGLNLSLQNGMNLTRQAYYYNDFDYSVNTSVATGFDQQQQQQQHQHARQQHEQLLQPHQHQQQHHGHGGLTLQSLDTQRNSPLNLEHRSSPLNLTHTRNNNNNKNQQHHHPHPQAYDHQQYFNFNAAAAVAATSYNNYSSSSNNDMLFNYSNVGTASGSSAAAVTTTSPTVAAASTANYYSYDQYNNYEQQQQNAKIRMFCSTCSQEFASSNELNKHMEKHNNQLGQEDVASSLNNVASLNIIPLCNYCGQGMQMNGPKHVCTRTTNNVVWNTNPQHEQPQQQHQDDFTQETYEAAMNFSSDKHEVVVNVEAAAVIGSSSKKLQPEMSSIVSQMPNNRYVSIATLLTLTTEHRGC